MNENEKGAELEGLGDISSGEKKESAAGHPKKRVIAAEKPSKPITAWQFGIFAVVVIILMFGFVFGPKMWQKAEIDKNKYNNFDFFKGPDGFWYTMVQKGNQPYQIPFYYHPRDLVGITVEPGLKEKFFGIRDNNGSIFITLDPEADPKIVVAGVEIAKITGKGYALLNVPTRSAFIRPPKNMTTNVETPIITCDYADSKTMVIWLVRSDKDIVYSYDNCVRVEAKSDDDMIKVADRMMYHLLGIMS
jgi:hypothetical protein